MAWTEQQSEAITTRDCGLIVSAAAGSGKTSVLVERLLRILEDETPEHRVPADRMIVVTFTNDAAAEMRSRLYRRWTTSCKNSRKTSGSISSRCVCKMRISVRSVPFVLI